MVMIRERETTFTLLSTPVPISTPSVFFKGKNISIRRDGISPYLKVNDKQLKTAMVQPSIIFDEIKLSVTASKYGMITVETTSFLPLNSFKGGKKVKMVSPKEQSFLHLTKHCDPGIYPYLILFNSQRI